MDDDALPDDNLPRLRNAPVPENPDTLLRLQEALRLRAPLAFAEQARQAGAERNKACLTLLCRVVHRGNRVLAHRAEWKQARIAAIEALAQMQDASVLPILIRAAGDREERVRDAASAALLTFGSKSVSPMIQTLATSHSWSQHGMKTILATLGKLESRQAAPTLARVLFGEYPPAPSRWWQSTLLYPTLVTLFIAACLWLNVTATGLLSVMALIGITIGCLVVLGMVEAFFILPISAVRHGGERLKLAVEAAHSLNRIKDKLALPSLISAAYGYRRLPRPVAHEVLNDLLPLLDANDEGLLRQDTLQLLLTEMGRADPAHTLTILRSLEFIGLGSAVPAVERLGERGATPEIKNEALRILPILEARRRQEQASTHLLRASGLPQAAPETLLRAASYQGEAAPELLLRPSQNSESD